MIRSSDRVYAGEYIDFLNPGRQCLIAEGVILLAASCSRKGKR